MPIKPSPTIAGKLRKLFSNNKQTIEPAIDDTLPGGSGGANVLTLYVTNISASASPTAFKDQNHTERYESFDEAANAVSTASSIKVVVATNPTVYFADSYTVLSLAPIPALPSSVSATVVVDGLPVTVILFRDGPEPAL